MIIRVVIPRRSRKCHTCDKHFFEGHEYVSALIERDEEGEYGRFDVCNSCWSSEIAHEFTTYWKAKIPLRAKKASDSEEHFMEVFDFLRDQLEKNTKESSQKAFLLAMYLHRKKKLTFLKDWIREGISYQIYEIPETEEVLSIPKQLPSEEELSIVQQEFKELFLS